MGESGAMNRLVLDASPLRRTLEKTTDIVSHPLIYPMPRAHEKWKPDRSLQRWLYQEKGRHRMTDQQVPTIAGLSFEDLKKTNGYEAEYWSARDLQSLLGYGQWRRFEDTVKRAIASCEQSGNDPSHHFAGAGKMIELGSGSAREVEDYQLSRFACYLIAQNGDPRKPEIAAAQKYFAIQTRRQELTDQHAADRERLELRKQTSEEFKALSGAAQQAGVQSRMFGIFHDAGYKGLYGGLGGEDIKARKGIPSKENLMDRMNATELAANQFRMTQTRDKLLWRPASS